MERRPKCKVCKSHFIPSYPGKKVCHSQDCWDSFILSEKLRQWNKEKPKLKEQLMTLSKSVKAVEKHFNHFIRLRDKGKPCVSCGTPYNSDFHAGHFHSAGHHWAVRFDESNVHGQCIKCNDHLSGNQGNYRKRILKRISQDELDRIDDLSTMDSNFTRMYLKHLSEVYKNKCKNLG
jgi:hypothetical protein